MATLGLLIVGCAARESFKEVFPGVRLDLDSKLVSIEGAVCLEAGILEYLAVTEGGKEYESLIRLACRPAHLQQALLMADYQVGEVTQEARGDFAPGSDAAASERPADAPQIAQPPEEYWQKDTPRPTYVTIAIETEERGGARKRWPIEDFLTDRETGGRPKQLQWAFTGSFFFQRRSDSAEAFAADQSGSVIGLWYDPSCLLNLAEDVGNPYRGDAIGLEVNSAVVPSTGTRVRLILQPLRADRRG